MSAPADELQIDRQAAVERILLAPSSWVDFVPRFVRDAQAAFTELHETVAWTQTEVLRYDKYVPENRLGAGVRNEAFPLLRQTDLHLTSRYHVPFAGVSAILYRDGRDFQGLHSDRELRWLDDTVIAIVVLGARRPFVLRPRLERGVPIERIPAGAGPDDVILMPGEGDMLVMGGACQREWLHGVPGASTVERPRISLTWRWTSRRGRPDTNPTYYEGRHFSDGPRLAGSRYRRP